MCLYDIFAKYIDISYIYSFLFTSKVVFIINNENGNKDQQYC